jgi:AcrR family transcriptional regulator
VAGRDSEREPGAPAADAAERGRLVAAFAKAAGEHGYAGLELGHVLRYAGVPQATLDLHFQTKEQGLLAAHNAFLERLWLDVHAACDTTTEWPLKVRAALRAVLSSVVEASNLARAFAIEAPAASLAAAERQFTTLDQLAALLRDGRRHYPAAASLPPATERTVVGGIASIVIAHLLVEEPQAISDLETELVELILIPYLGQGEARLAATS